MLVWLVRSVYVIQIIAVEVVAKVDGMLVSYLDLHIEIDSERQ